MLCNLPLKAQSTFGSVRGATVDQTGSPTAGAQVTLHSLDENTDAVAVADGDGNFLFENLKPGHYKLTAVKDGLPTAWSIKSSWPRGRRCGRK